MVSHRGLICISLMISDGEHPFMCLLVIYLYVFFTEVTIQALCPNLIGLFLFDVELREFLHVFDINPLLHISFANIFYSVGCLFFL